MDTTTTTQPASKRAVRKSSVILTDRICEKRVTERVKIYDRKCPGLYVSITTAGVASFSFKFTDPATGKQRTGWLGVYNPETFAVEDARSRVYGLRGTGAAVVAETFRDRKVRQAKQGKTVDEIIEERIEWMKTPVRKPDGEMRPRIESWNNVASHLRRFISPRLGKKIASEVTKHDIATLSNGIVAGKLGVPSVANARHMRRAASGLFNWAAEAGRDYVTASPCCQSAEARPGASAHAGPLRGRDQNLLARPRPNNPVGTVWINLSAEGYGIHGTPFPAKVSKAESHGCVRLTNWDAERVAERVGKGTQVAFVEGTR
jgi:hypothetical protein